MGSLSSYRAGAHLHPVAETLQEAVSGSQDRDMGPVAALGPLFPYRKPGIEEHHCLGCCGHQEMLGKE